MLFLLVALCLAGVCGAEYTLPGECPDVKLQENLDPTKFSGLWYNVASYASDGREIYDCSTIEFQEDNMGYMYKETYVQMDQGNRTQKTYQARVDPTFDAGKNAVFIMSHEDGDKVLQFPFFILATDYDGYAIAYTCRWLKEKIRMHYVFTWVLTRSKEKLEGELLKKVEDKLSKYTDLAEHRQSFVFKDFSDASCAYTNKLESDFFTVFTWVLTRNKGKLEGELLKKVEDKLSKYTELAENRQSFVFKDFSDASCAYTNKREPDFFTNNFW